MSEVKRSEFIKNLVLSLATTASSCLVKNIFLSTVSHHFQISTFVSAKDPKAQKDKIEIRFTERDSRNICLERICSRTRIKKIKKTPQNPTRAIKCMYFSFHTSRAFCCLPEIIGVLTSARVLRGSTVATEGVELPSSCPSFTLGTR